MDNGGAGRMRIERGRGNLAGVTGTFRFLPAESAEPVTAQVIKTSDAIMADS